MSGMMAATRRESSARRGFWRRAAASASNPPTNNAPRASGSLCSEQAFSKPRSRRQGCEKQREGRGKQRNILQQKLLQQRRDDRETGRAFLSDPRRGENERRGQEKRGASHGGPQGRRHRDH